MNATNLKTHLAMSVFLLAMVLMLCADMARGQAEGQVQEEWVARYNGPGNGEDRAWIISSFGLPDFPYQSANGNGLYITRGIWRSGRNPYWMKPKTLYRRR